MEVMRQIEIDMGHRIPFHKSKFKNPHGHRYKIQAVVDAPVNTISNCDGTEGMVMDYGDMKEIMMKEIYDIFDHGFVIYEKDNMLLTCFFEEIPKMEKSDKYYKNSFFHKQRIEKYNILFTFNLILVRDIPTAENLAKLWFNILKDAGLPMSRLRVYETPNTWAEYAEAKKDVS